MFDIAALVGFPDISIESQEIVDDVLHLYCVPKHPTSICCPQCGSTLKQSNGKYVRTFQDLPICGKHTMVHIKTNQFLCKNPKCTCTSYVPRFVGVGAKDEISIRLKETILRDSLKKTTFVYVASKYGVDEKIVRSVFNEYVNSVEESSTYAPVKHLAVDEAHLAKQARLVLVDTGVYPSKIIDIGQVGARKAPLIEALYRFEDYKSIETITIDMSHAYLSAIDMVYPDRKKTDEYGKIKGPRVIIDRFHVMAHFLDATEVVRSTLYKRLRQSLNEIEDVEQREIAKKKLGNLGMSPYWYKKNFEDMSDTMKRRLMYFTSVYPEFATLLQVREKFRDFYDNSVDIKDAEKRYSLWLKSLPKDPAYDVYEDFIDTVDKHHHEIFNYFADPIGCRFTNAQVENRNGLIKEIMHLAKGASFETIRAKVLYGENRVESSTSISAKRKLPTGPWSLALRDYMEGICTDDVVSSVRSTFKTCLANDLVMANPGLSYAAAMLRVQEENLADDGALQTIFTNSNTSGKMLMTAERLDAEDAPSHPVLLGVPVEEFSIEAKFYLINDEGLTTPLNDYFY